MEHLARKIAESVGANLQKTDQEIAVMAYGLIGILQFMAIFILTSIISLIFGFWFESLIVFLSVGFLRRLTGGAHSAGIYSCIVYSTVFVCGISAISVYLLPKVNFFINLLICFLIFAFGYVMIALKAPVTPPNKPCRTEEKRKRLRKGSFIVLTLFLITVVCFMIARSLHSVFYSCGLALALSTLWQISMMTKPGHIFIESMDKIFISKKQN